MGYSDDQDRMWADVFVWPELPVLPTSEGSRQEKRESMRSGPRVGVLGASVKPERSTARNKNTAHTSIAPLSMDCAEEGKECLVMIASWSPISLGLEFAAISATAAAGQMGMPHNLQ